MSRLMVEKKQEENSLGLFRRFTKKVQRSRVLQTAKKGVFFERKKSKFVIKKDALIKIQKQEARAKKWDEGVTSSKKRR